MGVPAADDGPHDTSDLRLYSTSAYAAMRCVLRVRLYYVSYYAHLICSAYNIILLIYCPIYISSIMFDNIRVFAYVCRYKYQLSYVYINTDQSGGYMW